MSGSDRLIGLIPLAFGGMIIGLARPIADGMANMAEWQLRVMRHPAFVWYYRVFGLIFAAFGIAFVFQS